MVAKKFLGLPGHSCLCAEPRIKPPEGFLPIQWVLKLTKMKILFASCISVQVIVACVKEQKKQDLKFGMNLQFVATMQYPPLGLPFPFGDLVEWEKRIIWRSPTVYFPNGMKSNWI